MSDVTALIDGDIVCYRCAASAENDAVEVALTRADEFMQRILFQTSSKEYAVFLTGRENYRYKFNPEYKANRKDKPKPKWLYPLQEHLVTQWGAKFSEGCEADDLLAIEQTKNVENTVICTIDKDLLQVPGNHFNFVKEQLSTVSPVEGLRNFYWQMIMGDRSDNIFGFDGVARASVPKKMESMYHELQEMEDEVQMFDYVRFAYGNDDRFTMNGMCLWIQRKPEEIWLENVQSLMEATGQNLDFEGSSLPLFVLGPGDGLPSTKP